MLAWDEIDTLLVDMDGTVLDLAFDNHFWLEFIPRQYAAARTLSLDSARAELMPRYQSVEGTLPWYCIDHWSRELELDIAELKRGQTDRIRVLPGALEFLHAARSHGKTLALVTNAHRTTLQIKLATTGVAVAFDEIFSSHDFGAPKEDPKFWHAFSQAWTFDPQRSVMIDDSLSVLRAARDYGIGHQLAITCPDSSLPGRVVDEFPAVETLGHATASLSIPER